MITITSYKMGSATGVQGLVRDLPAALGAGRSRYSVHE